MIKIRVYNGGTYIYDIIKWQVYDNIIYIYIYLYIEILWRDKKTQFQTIFNLLLLLIIGLLMIL
jgi:hypothetical protein